MSDATAYTLARVANRARLIAQDHYADYLHYMTEAHALALEADADRMHDLDTSAATWRPHYATALIREWRSEARNHRYAAYHATFILTGDYPHRPRWNPPAA